MQNHSITCAYISAGNFSKEPRTNTQNVQQTNPIEVSDLLHQDAHVYVVFALTIVGLLTNIANLVVFTRKDMRLPSNVILIGVSIADFVMLVLYTKITYDSHFGPENMKIPSGWPLNVFSVLTSISIWLTVLLAVWRHLAAARTKKSCGWRNVQNTCKVVVFVYLLCAVLYIPSFFSKNSITNGTASEKGEGNGSTSTDDAKAESEERPSAFVLYCGISDLLIKFTGSVVLAVLTLKLICKLKEVGKRQRTLSQGFRQDGRTRRKVNRTIAWLFIRLLLFLISVLLQAFFILFSQFGCKVCRTYNEYYEVFIEVAVLINPVATFLLYYFMSSQFRTTFNSLLKSTGHTRYQVDETEFS